jgi:hypothetical protein
VLCDANAPTGWDGYSENETPAGFLQRGLVLTNSRAYFLQQALCALQQAPPLQQPATAERNGVALDVPISARAAVIINRYFIKSFC